MAAKPDGVPDIQDKDAGCSETVQLLTLQFEQFYSTVLAYLIHRLFDRELAEELTAETFYRAARSVRRLHGNTRQIQVWLLRTATNLANTHYRRRRLHKRLLQQFSRTIPAVMESDPPGESAEQQRAVRIREILKTLPPKHQTVVTLRYYMQMSFDDIAEVLGCRPDAARKRLSRAIKDMRRRVKSADRVDVQRLSVEGS